MITRIPFWRPDAGGLGEVFQTDAWSTAWIGGRQLPGLVEIQGLDAAWLADTKKPAGKSGATITTTGRKPAAFKIRVKMWTQDQWDAFLEVDDSLTPTRRKSEPKAYDLQHPRATLWSVRSIIIIGCSGPEIDPNGIGVITYSVQEWDPPARRTATSTPTASFARDQRKRAPAAATTPAAPAATPSKYRPVNQAQRPSETDDGAAP